MGLKLGIKGRKRPVSRKELEFDWIWKSNNFSRLDSSLLLDRLDGSRLSSRIERVRTDHERIEHRKIGRNNVTFLIIEEGDSARFQFTLRRTG